MFDNTLHDTATKVHETLKTLDASVVDNLDETSTLEFDEWFAIGPMFSLASSAQIIDLDVAQQLHVWHTDFNDGLPLAERIVFLSFVGELIPRLREAGLS